MADTLGPRLLPHEESEEGLLTNEAINGILDLFKCPICLDVFDQPCRVRDCGHIFCQECAERNGRLQKPAYCALCRKNILTRRDLRKDLKLQSIMQSIIPDMKRYKQYMGIYMLEKSGQQLFQEVSKQNLYEISLKI